MTPLGFDREYPGLVRNVREVSGVLLLDPLEVRLVVPVLALCRHLLHLEALEVQTSGYSTFVLARVWHEPPEGIKFYMKRAIVSMLLVKSLEKMQAFLKRTLAAHLMN